MVVMGTGSADAAGAGADVFKERAGCQFRSGESTHPKPAAAAPTTTHGAQLDRQRRPESQTHESSVLLRVFRPWREVESGFNWIQLSLNHDDHRSSSNHNHLKPRLGAITPSVAPALLPRPPLTFRCRDVQQRVHLKTTACSPGLSQQGRSPSTGGREGESVLLISRLRAAGAVSARHISMARVCLFV